MKQGDDKKIPLPPPDAGNRPGYDANPNPTPHIDTRPTVLPSGKTVEEKVEKWIDKALKEAKS